MGFFFAVMTVNFCKNLLKVLPGDATKFRCICDFTISMFVLNEFHSILNNIKKIVLELQTSISFLMFSPLMVINTLSGCLAISSPWKFIKISSVRLCQSKVFLIPQINSESAFFWGFERNYLNHEIWLQWLIFFSNNVQIKN